MFTAENLESDVAQITESVFANMLGMEMARTHDSEVDQGAKVTGVVTVSGSWSGAITVSCSLACARRIGSTMFGTEPDATSESEINDAIGEMANMIGGNFKSMLPPPTQLSLPTVTQGERLRVNLPGCREVGHYHFRAGDDMVTVGVVERV